jgi:class 3 adenylate cyclase
MATKLSFLNTLSLLQTFETYWAYYSLSNGKIYSTACRKSAKSFAESLQQIAMDDKRVIDPVSLNFDEDIDPVKIIRSLANWEPTSDIAPIENITTSIRCMASYFIALKSLLYKSTGLTADPMVQTNREELMYRGDVERWQAHLPTMLLMGKESPEDLLKKATESPSIVVTGNIGKLQDLMTYAKDAQSYSSFILKFIERTRMLTDEYMGIFDKFTGSGFIAYFNKVICETTGLNMVDCFTNFVRDEALFASDLFNSWGRTIRKLPAEPVGLSMGADFGSVEYKDLAGQLVTVGEPLIWSRRLAETSSPGEVVVNNLLHEALESRSDIQSEGKVYETESGEKFQAKSLSFY